MSNIRTCAMIFEIKIDNFEDLATYQQILVDLQRALDAATLMTVWIDPNYQDTEDAIFDHRDRDDSMTPEEEKKAYKVDP